MPFFFSSAPFLVLETSDVGPEWSLPCCPEGPVLPLLAGSSLISALFSPFRAWCPLPCIHFLPSPLNSPLFTLLSFPHGLGLCRQCPKLAMARHVEESVKPHLAMMCALVSRQRQEQQELRRELEELSVGSDGVLIWKIGSYGRRLQEAKAKPNLECFSPAFYTHKYGYKLQVSAFLNGNGSGEGTHLSLYIRVLPGAFDNLLEWPFARRVTFSLLDQSDPGLAKPQHVTETFHPDPNWKNFQKPGTWRGSLDESSLGFGYPKFISHQDIRKRNYVRDDAVFIRASVELPRKILS